MPNALYSMRLNDDDKARMAQLMAHHGVANPVDVFRMGMKALEREKDVIVDMRRIMLTPRCVSEEGGNE